MNTTSTTFTVNKCARIKAIGENRNPPRQCIQCDVAHCLFNDLLQVKRGRKRKKRRIGTPKGMKYPRERSNAETDDTVLIDRSSLPDSYGHLYGGLVDHRYMREHAYNEVTGVDMYNIHTWSTPDEGDALERWYGFNSMYLTWAGISNLAQIAFLDMWNGSFVFDKDTQAVPYYLPWKMAERVRANGLYHMKPQLTTGISLVNFLLELKDFKSWFNGKGIRNIANELKSLRRNTTSVRHGSVSGTLNDLSNLVASGVLTVSFAIKPLINDIGKLCDVLQSFWSRTQAFIEKSKTLELRRHYRSNAIVTDQLTKDLSFDLLIPAPDGEPTVLKCVPSFEPFVRNGYQVKSNEWLYHATMDYDYTVRELIEWDSQFSGLLQQLGIQPNAAIIWNALPWTFVADWFVRISDWLDANYSEDVMSSNLTVHSWVESYGMRLRYDISSAEISPGSGIYGVGNFPFVGSFYADVYRRGPAEPPDPETYRSLDVDQGISSPRYAVSLALLKRVLSK